MQIIRQISEMLQIKANVYRASPSRFTCVTRDNERANEHVYPESVTRPRDELQRGIHRFPMDEICRGVYYRESRPRREAEARESGLNGGCGIGIVS